MSLWNYKQITYKRKINISFDKGGIAMNYNIIDIAPTLTDNELKIIINRKLFKYILFMETSLNNSE